MRLTVLGSGSRGNAVLVESDGDALLVDAGFSHRELVRRAESAGVDLARVRAIALTHEHGDHARGAARAAAAWQVPIAASRGTLSALGRRIPSTTARHVLPASRPVALGGFRLTAYPTAHDAAEPIVLVVEDGAGRRLGVAYDVGSPTAALQLACRGLDALVVEANHDEVLLRSSAYPASVRARIAGRGGHLSNTQAATLAAEVAHIGLSVVVLAHLSDRCNRADLALAAMEAALRPRGFAGRIVVASQDTPTPPLEVGTAPAQFALPLGGAR
jgi:phosphoribosyl 1,2-cyclic phosphodiesterase